ncbi:MAG: hypothetical protein JSU01_19385 [Bacteroidetes bacterium]|nr:hypothetical protein [Bacteroidota bacterium]
MRRYLMPLVVLSVMIGGCAMYQSIVKSSFPYTSTLTISAAAPTGAETSAINTATSFDQNFSKNGKMADKITLVRVISAKLMSVEPTDYNIGNLSSVKIYLSKGNGDDEMLVAQREDISPNAGNNITLDIDNSKMLDELVREPSIRVRMTYKVRQSYRIDANVHVVLGLAAYPKPADKDK